MKAAVAANDLARAILLAEAAIRDGAEDPLVFNVAAHGLQVQRRYREGLELLVRANRLAPRDPYILIGIGQNLSQQGRRPEAEAKIVELTETGEMAALEKRRAEVPPEVRQFLRLPGLGPKTAARIWRELDVTTLDGLREAAEQQRLRTLQGLGAKSEEKILEALAKGFGPEPERRGLLGVGLPVVQEVVEALREHPAAVEVSGAGSVRRPGARDMGAPSGRVQEAPRVMPAFFKTSGGTPNSRHAP